MDYYPQEIDLFASGILLFMMFQGNPPFQYATPNDPFYKLLMRNKLKFWIAHSRRHKQGLKYFSADFRDLVRKLLAFQVEKRLSVEQILAHPWMQRKMATTHEV
jgi:serine/threonine protein kinase